MHLCIKHKAYIDGIKRQKCKPSQFILLKTKEINKKLSKCPPPSPDGGVLDINSNEVMVWYGNE